MCSTIKKLILISFYFKSIKADICNATEQNMLFFLLVDLILRFYFVSFCIYNVRIILISKSFWVHTKDVKGSSVEHLT